MWSLSGDISPGPPGTYYFHPSGYSSYYWHIFDQLLIRPDLLEFFDHNTLKVVDTDGEKSLLLDNGTPDKFQTSDHLPLLFQIELTFTFW
ncbi:hypothetical protein KFU94_64775 [Chloroflexi bacterium TSY]|nr:hypothetical protein [Chloroflexi bacterium TSY]